MHTRLVKVICLVIVICVEIIPNVSQLVLFGVIDGTVTGLEIICKVSVAAVSHRCF